MCDNVDFVLTTRAALTALLADVAAIRAAVEVLARRSVEHAGELRALRGQARE